MSINNERHAKAAQHDFNMSVKAADINGAEIESALQALTIAKALKL